MVFASESNPSLASVLPPPAKRQKQDMPSIAIDDENKTPVELKSSPALPTLTAKRGSCPGDASKEFA